MWRVPFSRADGNIGTLMELTVPGALVPRRAAPVLLTSWRTFAEWLRAFDARHLAHPRLRRVLKATSDFVCVALSVTAAIAVADGGVPTFGVGGTALLALALGCFLVAAQTLAGSYRTMWRYTSLQEARVLASSSLLMLAVLLLARWLDLVSLSGSTILLIVLLMLCTCIGVRTLRRWQMT